MPDVPTALPDRVKIRKLIKARGFSIEGVARRIGRPPNTIYAITGRTVPKPTGVEILADLAAELSTPKRRIKVSDISDWVDKDDLDDEPEPEALASLDAENGPAAGTTGPTSGIRLAPHSNKRRDTTQ